MTKRIPAFIFAAQIAFAGSQSASLNQGMTGTLTLPNTAPYTYAVEQNESFRMQFRVHNWQAPAPGVPFWERTIFATTADGIWCSIDSTSTLSCTSFWDAMSDTGVYLSVASLPDFVVTLSRDMSANRFQMQVCDVSLSNCTTSTALRITGAGGGSSGGVRIGSITFGAQALTADLAYFRWQTGTGLGTPPRETDGPSNLVDLEFEGNGFDSSGNGLAAVAFSPAAAFVSTPLYKPACNAGASATFRAGFPVSLDASGSQPLNGGAVLNYFWQQLSGPTQVRWSGRTTVHPVIEGMRFGNYVFGLTVTDGSGNTSQCSVTDGAVATDSNDTVITGSSQFDHFVSPAIRWGANPWPWFDQMASQTGQLFVGKQASDFLPLWRTASPHGTISFPVTTSSTTITGTGTQFSADFFNGSCNNSWNGNYLIVWYQTAWGTKGYRFATPISCASDISMTIREPTYYAVTPVVNAQYSTMTTPQLSVWINGSNNANYYDNVLAYYTLWRTTGLDYWHQAATQLADLWWENPGIDQGLSCWDGGYRGQGLQGYSCSPNRVWAIFGLMLRALDGRSSMWENGLYTMIDNITNNNSPAGVIVDTREDSARMGQVCAAAMLMYETGATDTARLNTYKAFCQAEVNIHFAPRVGPNGEFTSPQFGITSNNLGLSTATVTAGSMTVASAAGDFPCSSVITGTSDGASRMWFVQDNTLPSFASGGDTMSYAVDQCTARTITLHVPYSGALSGSGRGYTLNQLGGSFTQPFLMGYMAGQFALAAEAMTVLGDSATSATAQSIAARLAAYIVNPVYGGYRPATNGLFYARNGLVNDGTVGDPDGSGACEPDPEIANNNGGICTGVPNYSDSIQGSRFLGAETVRALSHGYLYSRDQSLKAAVDDFYGKMWGGLGGTGADSNYLSAFFPSAETGKAKDFGFCCGLGGGAEWAAARNGGVRPLSLRTVMIPFSLVAVSNAASALVTVSQPTGVAVATQCRVSPCSVSVDTRTGSHQVEIDYRDASGRTIAKGEPVLLYVP